MNEDQLHRCVRCSAETALRRPSLEEHQDVPITVPQEWPLCAACAVEHGQPDNDRHQLRAIKDALRIRRDAVIYYGHFDGSEIFDSPLRRYRIETASVCRGDVPQRFLGIYHSIEPGKYRLVYPWVYRLPQTSGPGVVIRWRFYKPGMQSHVVSWWDPVARRVRYEPRGLDLARRAEWDEMEPSLCASNSARSWDDRGEAASSPTRRSSGRRWSRSSRSWSGRANGRPNSSLPSTWITPQRSGTRHTERAP